MCLILPASFLHERRCVAMPVPVMKWLIHNGHYVLFFATCVINVATGTVALASASFFFISFVMNPVLSNSRRYLGTKVFICRSVLHLSMLNSNLLRVTLVVLLLRAFDWMVAVIEELFSATFADEVFGGNDT